MLHLMMAPLTVAIMSGLVFATFLSLVVVPVFYALLFRVRFKDYRWE
jgi:multidrug efflux pump subunit AcrB